MKKTVNINLGGIAFLIDEDAYAQLEGYLNSLRKQFKNLEEQDDIIEDIEYRIAEIFSEKLQGEVVNTAMVNEVIKTMGTPSEIDEELDGEEEPASTKKAEKKKVRRFFRNPDDVFLSGLLSGLSSYLGIADPLWLRLLTIVLVIGGAGFPVPLYVVLWLIIPKAKNASEKLQMKGEPINVGSISELVQKDSNTTRIQRKATTVFSGVGEIVLVGIKVFVIAAAALFAIKMFGLLVGFGTIAVVGNIFLAPELSLLIPSMASFNLGLLALFFMAVIPLAALLYLVIQAIRKKEIAWGKLLATTILTWILSIGGLLTVVVFFAADFKNEATKETTIVLENHSNSTLYIAQEENEFEIEEEFEVIFDDGEIVTQGFRYDNEEKILAIHLLDLRILPTEDTLASVISEYSSRGKTINQAEENMSKITSTVNLVDSNKLVFPRYLTLDNIDQYRIQQLKFKLYVPIGDTLFFQDEMVDLVRLSSLAQGEDKSDLFNNQWIMTEDGLECLTCF